MNGGLVEAQVERAALELLESMGWEWRNCQDETFGVEGDFKREKEEPFLASRVRAALRKLNPDVPAAALEQAYEELTRDRSAMSLVRANQDIYSLLKEGVKVNVHLEDGGTQLEVVKVIDWVDVGRNDFFFAQQFWMAGEISNRRADLVGFVNGLPLVFIELKAPGKSVKDAFDDNFRDYKTVVPQLFSANGVVLLSNGLDTKVGSLTGAWEHFKDWKRIEREDEAPRVSLETALRGVCEPKRLLDIVENFTVFSEQQAGTAKIVSQNHQYLGVNSAMRAVERIKDNQGRLGVFWHTQGSGKSFSMLFFSQKILRKVHGDWTFLILTDREDLDDQIYKTFAGCGAVKAAGGTKRSNKDKMVGVQATSGEHLKKLLTENHRYVFTLIQKFQLDKEERLHKKRYPQLSDRSNIIVIADEAHRSQYDTFARNLRHALPNAAFIGFTGTPLMAGEEQTKETFGDYISVYNFRQAIEDNATVPLYYENRIPELQLTNDDFSKDLADIIENADLDEEQAEAVEREFGRQYHLITRDERLDAVAKDIVEHHMGLEERGKAMVIAIDKVTAVRLYDKVKGAWAAKLQDLEAQLAKLTVAPVQRRQRLERDVAYMQRTDMAVVVSEAQNELEDFKKKGLDIAPHRKRMKKTDIDTEFKDDDSDLRIVFVCAMWLTGFDVPSCSTIYLDKPMRNHSLMQTIARANRVYPDKLNGLIVDYVGVFRNLQKALAIYGAATKGDGTDLPVAPKDELVEELETLIVGTKEFCSGQGVQIDAIHQGTTLERIAKLKDAREALIYPDDARRKFLLLAGRVDRLFKSIGLDERLDKFVPDRDLFRLIANAIRAELDPVDISDVMDKVDKLLDESIDATGYVIPSPEPSGVAEGKSPYGVDLSKIDFEALSRHFNKSKSRRATINALHRAAEDKVEQMMRDNPTRTDFYDKLQKMIEEYNSGAMTVEQALKEAEEFFNSLSTEDKRHLEENLSVEELAIYDLLTKPSVELNKKGRQRVKDLSKALLERLKREKLVLDWRKKARRKAAVRTCILDTLDDLPESYNDDLFDQKCQRIYEHVYESYWGDGHGKYEDVG